MFLHPWAIALGVAAVGLPWAIHLLTKPRPARLPLSTLRFVREAIQQRAARHKLRDWIVLLLRSLALLLVACAIARPRFGSQPLVADSGNEDAVRVVLLDVSQSLGTVQDGVERLERARTMAAAHLRFRPQLRMNLILAAATPRAVFTEPSTNAESLRTELAEAVVLPERCDVKAALSLAAKMLAPKSASDKRKRELVIVSDFQRANWAKADFTPLAKDIVIQFESVATGETPANVAVLSARACGRSAVDGDTLLEVEIGNFSKAARKATIEVTLGQATHRLEGTVGAGERLMLTEAVKLTNSGWQVGAATLMNLDDSLAADDWRPLVVHVEPPPVYALLTRQPASQRPSSSHYLECALLPNMRPGVNSSQPQIVRIDPDTPDRESFARASAVVVDHPGGLSPEAIQLLAGALRNGRPVLYVASELIDATNLHKLNEVLGASLQLPVEFLPPTEGAARNELKLVSFRADDPPFQAFGDSAKSVFGRLRFAGGLATRPREGMLADDLLASYSDGSAGLVVASSERSSLAVLNADLERSNLPTTPEAFVPLMQELLQLLLARQTAAAEGFCGEPFVARLPVTATVKDLTIRPPKQSADDLGELADEGLGVVWSWKEPTARGVYQIQKQNETVFALAMNLPEEESNLEALPADVLQTRLAAGRSVYYRSAGDDPNSSRDVWWTWLLAGCVVCLIGELAALVGFRT